MTASVVFILRYFKNKQTVIWSKNSSFFFFPGLNYKTTKLVTRRIYTSSPFVVSIKGSAQRLEELSVLVTVRELIIRLLAKMLTAASH